MRGIGVEDEQEQAHATAACGDLLEGRPDKFRGNGCGYLSTHGAECKDKQKGSTAQHDLEACHRSDTHKSRTLASRNRTSIENRTSGCCPNGS